MRLAFPDPALTAEGIVLRRLVPDDIPWITAACSDRELRPRTVRFYAAVAVLTLGPDRQIANAGRDLTTAVGALPDVMAAKERNTLGHATA